MHSLARRGLSAVVVAALLTFAPIASGGAFADEEPIAETPVEAPVEAPEDAPADEPADEPVVEQPAADDAPAEEATEEAPVQSRPTASRMSFAASSSELQYGPGTGTAPISVTVDGTQLTASWAATIDGPTYGYRVHLFDYTANAYVLEVNGYMATSYTATIVRGHHYLAFYQDMTTNMANYRNGYVDFTPPVTPAPNAPTAFTATRLATANGFDLTWAAPANNSNPATSYRVDVTTGGTTQSFTTAQLAYRLSGLTIGAGYSFAVTSIADDAKTSQPVTTSAALGVVAPTAVQNLSFTLSGTRFTSTWTAPAYDGGGPVRYNYKFYRDNVLLGDHSVVDTEFIALAALVYEAEYHVVVSAVSGTGAYGPGSVSASVVPPTPAPNAPTSVSATRLTAANGFDLSWNAPTENTDNPATGYSVDVTSGASTVRYTTTDPSYRVTGLIVGQSYTFAVSSIAADAQVSVAASATATLTSTLPSAVTDVVLSSTGSALSATWTAPAYDGGAAPLEYVVTLFGDNQFISSDRVSGRSIGFTEIADYGVTYTADVQPVSSDDLDGPTTASNGVKRADAVPGAPLAWAEGYGYQNAMVYLTWDLAATAGSPIQSLLVSLYDGSGVVVQQWTLSSAYTSYSFAGLPNDTAYTASVVATNLAGSSVESNRAPATTLGVIPPAYTPQQLAQYGNYAGVTVALSGTELTAHLDGIAAGTWVFGHAYSTPSPLGWTQVDAAGFARWSIAGAGLATGATHTLAVQDGFGGLLGSATFDIAAPVRAAALAHTGSDPANWLAIALAMLAFGAYVSVSHARRRASAS